MPFTYSVFGLTLLSNLPIPALIPSELESRPADIEILWNRTPWADGFDLQSNKDLIYRSSYTDARGNPDLRIWAMAEGALFHVAYCDGVRFWFARDQRRVWSNWPETSSKEDAAAYFLGPILGLLLRFRGTTCLHASAVVLSNSAVTFVGAEGAGKSTIAAAFATQGHAVLSDDVAALMESDGQFFVQPAYPYLSLWEDSTKTLFGSPDALPPFSQNFDKQRFSLKDAQSLFAERPLPLGAIYILGERSADRAPRVESLPPREALLALVANTYATNVLDAQMRAQEFEVLGKMLAKVPVRKLIPHQDTARCFESCDVVRKDFQGLPQ